MSGHAGPRAGDLERDCCAGRPSAVPPIPSSRPLPCSSKAGCSAPGLCLTSFPQEVCFAKRVCSRGNEGPRRRAAVDQAAPAGALPLEMGGRRVTGRGRGPLLGPWWGLAWWELGRELGEDIPRDWLGAHSWLHWVLSCKGLGGKIEKSQPWAKSRPSGPTGQGRGVARLPGFPRGSEFCCHGRPGHRRLYVPSLTVNRKCIGQRNCAARTSAGRVLSNVWASAGWSDG